MQLTFGQKIIISCVFIICIFDCDTVNGSPIVGGEEVTKDGVCIVLLHFVINFFAQNKIIVFVTSMCMCVRLHVGFTLNRPGTWICRFVASKGY